MTDSQRQDAKAPRRQEEPSKAVDELARAIIGAAIEVHRTLGPGYPESVYEEALCYEFVLREIPFDRQQPVYAVYKDHTCGEGRMDIFVGKQLVVELKAVDTVLPKFKAQCKAYLKATNCELALLINFNEAVLKDGIFRIVLTQP
ncbi:MAG: GxxExxY protein [Phycisphaeraceae bacterium]|nr:GxxExxY protein [Phycisphaeraceae bacterium]